MTRAREPRLEVTFIRCSTLLLRWGEQTFLTDPWFRMHMRGLPVFERPGLRPEDLPPLDALLVSHLHADHWDERAIDRLTTPPARMLLPPDALPHLRRREGVSMEEMTPWTQTRVGEVEITAVPGLHTFPPPGEINFVLSLPGWGVLYVGSDARFDAPTLTEVRRRFGPPRLAFLPVGGTLVLGRRTTMNPVEAFRAARILEAREVVPIHEGGIWMSVPPLSLHPGRGRHLARLLRRSVGGPRYRALRRGETATFA